jgi:hypothetical protein
MCGLADSGDSMAVLGAALHYTTISLAALQKLPAEVSSSTLPT